MLSNLSIYSSCSFTCNNIFCVQFIHFTLKGAVVNLLPLLVLFDSPSATACIEWHWITFTDSPSPVLSLIHLTCATTVNLTWLDLNQLNYQLYCYLTKLNWLTHSSLFSFSFSPSSLLRVSTVPRFRWLLLFSPRLCTRDTSLSLVIHSVSHSTDYLFNLTHWETHTHKTGD